MDAMDVDDGSTSRNDGNEAETEGTAKLRRSTRTRSARSDISAGAENMSQETPKARKVASVKRTPQNKADDQILNRESEEPDDAEENVEQEEGDDESGGSDGSDDDDETFGRRRGKPQSAKSTPSRQATRGARGRGKNVTGTSAAQKKRKITKDADVEEGSMFDIVMNHANAMEGQISDWVAEYNEDKVHALMDLVNFLIQSTGCPGRIEASVFEDQDNITDQLEELQKQFDAQTHQDYPIIAKSRGRGANKFRKNFTDFWSKWMARIRHNILFDDNGWCLEALVVWLVAMSSSVFRPFRHTATTVALVLLTGLCDIAKQVHNEWTTANRQLSTEQKKSSSGRKNQKVQQLEQRVEALHDKKVKLETQMNDLFDSVFVHRYRDSDPVIRTECIRELGLWIMRFPDMYLDPQYLRYLGWMLSDKSPTVRLEALRSLCRLYAVEAMASGLRAFTERFRPRMLEMALREKEVAVRIEAITAVTLVASAGLLEDDDRNSVLPLIFDEDAKVRGLLSKLAEDVWKEEYVEPKKDELKSGRIRPNVTEAQNGWAEIKALCQMLVHLAKTLDEQTRKRDAERRAKLATAAQDQGQSEAQTLGETQTQSLFTAESQNAMDLDEDIDDEDVSDEARDKQQRRRCDRLELFQWLSKDEKPVESVIGFGTVEAAVSALWGHISVLKDWQTMCNYLAHDFTDENEGASQAVSAANSYNPIRLTDEEETCLLYVVNAVLARIISDAHSAADHSKKKGTAKLEDVRMEVSRGLITHLPKLLKKYGGEYTGAGQRRVVEVVMMVRHIDIRIYLDMRMLKAYDSLFDDLRKAFLKHSSEDILSECAQTFRYLMGREKVEPSVSASGRQQRATNSNAVEADDASVASLHITTKQKVEELVEEVIGTQVATKLRDIEESIKNGVDVNLDTLYALRNALRRLGQLWNMLDLGGLGAIIKADDLRWNGLFELLNGVLNASLTIVTNRAETLRANESDPNGSLPSDEAANALDDIIQTALHVMCLDVAWELRKAFTTAIESTAESEVIDNHEAVPTEPVNISPEQAETFLKVFKEKCDRLMPIAEAIIVENEREWIQFRIGIKLSAFKVLTYMYLMLNGDAAVVFPEVARHPPEDVQDGSVDVLVRVVDALSLDIATDRKKAGDDDIRTLNADQTEVARHEVAKLIADLGRLIVHGLYDGKYSVMLLKYVGVGDDERYIHAVENGKIFVSMFGTIWDGLAEECVKDVIGMRIKVAAEEVIDEESDEPMQNRLKLFKRVTIKAAEVVFEGLKQSCDIYFRSHVSGIDAALSLAKILIDILKAWPDIVQTSPKLRVVHGLVVETLLDLLKRGGDEMVRRVEEWAVIHGGSVGDDELLLLRPRDVRKTLHEINEGWRVWGAVGGTVQQIVHELGTLKRGNDMNGDDEIIESVEDVVEHISQQLRAKGFKPGESDKDWQGYWGFVKALEKGDSSTKRRGRKAKAVVSREGTPETATAKPRQKRASKAHKGDELDKDSDATPKAKKAPRGRRKKAREDDGEEDEEEAVTAAPRRRSTRASTSARKTSYREIDEEEDEEGVIQDDQEEEFDEAEEADVPLMTTPAKAPAKDVNATPRTTPKATYKKRHTRTSAGSTRSSRANTPEEEDQVTPKAKPPPRNLKKPIQGLSNEEEDRSSPELPQAIEGRQTRGQKRGRVEPPRTPARNQKRVQRSSADSEGQVQDETNKENEGAIESLQERAMSDDGFVSSPEILAKKRVRVA
ncbi:uncharacterized protein SPPG_04684 [Spizellomyces punctatus DAOM BR117]|uniref:SCD domain-containing protein n=1 Tax=Spizellomyces punctatus (strain DAOM BR117) TaxID=645134 RepID=A0A0L0HHL9_SPIPD|nr:uncharacterized protein SPPG_04684 [Spizellomyces punctatus DAOM BR117]KND00360.1 hypothetical protein SPPG_04684 [Spizellomyces punctatus DAOM BR117]|eukprot:XP_016608399.1 hypothetical protein SPPG_04684 [Spizellomyces punctatus DAOM BR117]